MVKDISERRFGARCVGCDDWKQRVVSMTILVSTMGTRETRRQKSTGSLRLCPECQERMLNGRMPAAVRNALQNTYRQLGGAA